MKRMLILAGLAAAMLFLPACSSQESSDTRYGLPPVSANWQADGTYIVHIRNIQSYVDALKLLAVRTGKVKFIPIFPTDWNRRDAADYCQQVGMSLFSFDPEKEVLTCVGI